MRLFTALHLLMGSFIATVIIVTVIGSACPSTRRIASSLVCPENYELVVHSSCVGSPYNKRVVVEEWCEDNLGRKIEVSDFKLWAYLVVAAWPFVFIATLIAWWRIKKKLGELHIL